MKINPGNTHVVWMTGRYALADQTEHLELRFSKFTETIEYHVSIQVTSDCRLI